MASSSKVFALAVLAGFASGHSYHSSIAQLDYIAARKTIEVMVWLHTEDLEREFKREQGANATFDNQQAAESYVGAYLKKHFELRNRQRKLLEQKWVGLEVKVHFLTAYFEVPTDGLTGVTLTNRILLDRLPDQTNSAQVKIDGKARKDLTAITQALE